MTAINTANYDWDALRHYNDLQASNNPAERDRPIQLLQQLVTSPEGWQIVASILTEERVPFFSNGAGQNFVVEAEVKFFCCRVVEEFLRKRYATSDDNMRISMRQFLSAWLHRFVTTSEGSPEQFYIRNKAAQIFSLVFVEDYPSRWPSFLTDLLHFTEEVASRSDGAVGVAGQSAIDFFLRVLIAIDGEVVPREVSHTPEQHLRNTAIKDHMRLGDVERLVQSWYFVLRNLPHGADDGLPRLVLKVISLYISWIDITLIVNERFLSLFLSLLTSQGNGRLASSTSVRRKVCSCLSAICTKGMSPRNKLELVQGIAQELTNYQVLSMSEERLAAEEPKYLERLGELVNTMGVQLIDAYNKFLKEDPDAQKAAECMMAVEARIDCAKWLFRHKDDSVSASVSPLIHDYIALLKPLNGHNNNNSTKGFGAAKGEEAQKGKVGAQLVKTELSLTVERRMRIEELVKAVIEKMKYAQWYDFDKEGEDEVEFQEYRKELRTILTNLVGLDGDLVVNYTHRLIQDWLALAPEMRRFDDLEVVLSVFYHLGEALKSNKGDFFCRTYPHRESMLEMMRLVCSKEIAGFAHSAVQLLYFEIVVRYDRFFGSKPEIIFDVVMSFLDERGIRNSNGKVRSRSAYLLTRFIRSHRTPLQQYTEVILNRISDLLQVPLAPQTSGAAGLTGLSFNELAYIYEMAAQLIVAGPSDKLYFFRMLHQPVLSVYPQVALRLSCDTDPRLVEEGSEWLKSSADLISRTSRVFSAGQTMSSCGCIPAFVEAMSVFVSGLEVIPMTCPGRGTACVGVRAFLHRMVVCMDDQDSLHCLLERLPAAVSLLIRPPGMQGDTTRHQDLCRDLRELIPLINQVLARYKERARDFTNVVLHPLLSTLLYSLSWSLEADDLDAAEEVRLLRRAYFQLVHSLVDALPGALIALDSALLQEVLLSLVTGCDVCVANDPVALKIALAAFRLLVQAWGSDPQLTTHFILPHVVPALILLPSRPTFDLNDAQYSQALKEAANCQRVLLQKVGGQFVEFLRENFLPSLNFSPQLISEYLEALTKSQKEFHSFLNRFYASAKGS